MNKFHFSISVILTVWFAFLASYSSYAITPTIEATRIIESKKKLKFILKDGSSFRAFVVKKENDQIYTVSKRKQRKLALENDCANCAMTSIVEIEKIKPTKKLATIMAISFGAIVLFLFVAAIGLNYNAERNGNDSFGDVLFTSSNLYAAIVLLSLALFIGYSLGGAIDGAINGTK